MLDSLDSRNVSSSLPCLFDLLYQSDIDAAQLIHLFFQFLYPYFVLIFDIFSDFLESFNLLLFIFEIVVQFGHVLRVAVRLGFFQSVQLCLNLSDILILPVKDVEKGILQNVIKGILKSFMFDHRYDMYELSVTAFMHCLNGLEGSRYQNQLPPTDSFFYWLPTIMLSMPIQSLQFIECIVFGDYQT